MWVPVRIHVYPMTDVAIKLGSQRKEFEHAIIRNKPTYGMERKIKVRAGI